MSICATPAATRRRSFWTTQPDACGVYNAPCTGECGIPGLALGTPINQVAPAVTFATNDWVRSLLLNIFNTTARRDNVSCGLRPGSQGGHWSESYINTGTYIGTKMFSAIAPAKSAKEAIRLLSAVVAQDAYKLVTYGVATSVATNVVYLGNNRVSVDIDIIGPAIVSGRVNLIAKRIENSWVWEA